MIAKRRKEGARQKERGARRESEKLSWASLVNNVRENSIEILTHMRKDDKV